MKKKIIIIDNEPLIPALIKELIEEESEFEIAGIASDREQFFKLMQEDSFDAALVDISTDQKEGGLDLLRILKNEGFKIPVIMLSAHDEMTYAFKCLSLGASGYVNKIHICTELVDGLKEVLNGGLFVSGREGEKILKKYAEHRNYANP